MPLSAAKPTKKNNEIELGILKIYNDFQVKIMRNFSKIKNELFNLCGILPEDMGRQRAL